MPRVTKKWLNENVITPRFVPRPIGSQIIEMADGLEGKYILCPVEVPGVKKRLQEMGDSGGLYPYALDKWRKALGCWIVELVPYGNG